MRIPYGFILTSDGVLKINKDEADVISMIFDFYIAGASLGKIVDMFSGEEPVAAKKKATKIVKKLNANNKSHSRHFTVDFCKELGLNITELESDQTLQELVLSVHHAFIITIDATAATKLIENQNGARYITSQKK